MMLRVGRQVLTLYSVTSHDGPGPERNHCPRCRGGSLAMTARIRLQAAGQLVSGWCSCARAIASTNLRAGAIGCRRPSQAFRVRVGCPCPTVCHSGPGPASVTVKDSGHHASEFEGTKGAHLARRIGAFQNTTGVLPGDRLGQSLAPVEAPTTGPPWPWPVR